ncbi:hypothetical protein [Streptomyces yunnanensis]|uniref:Uncharacterized protein n=1 Tax=Streptomyces yunnanensis TaxID=156453 RepID=A0A9X8MZM3_9ACTN|nr:hypothetical protein [Streptomyces yunnanensis]SHM44928.1 hypothetical protein SAMN05216268_11151 [Streptomyces yunnanensis]
MPNSVKGSVDPTVEEASASADEVEVADLAGYLKHLTDRILPGVESRRDGARAADRPDVAAAYAEVAHLMMESVQALRNVAEGLGEGLGEGPVAQEERQAG